MAGLLRRHWKGLALLVCLVGIVAALTTGRPRPVMAAPPKDAAYVGVKKCKTCHFKDYRRWRKMKHAGSWKSMGEKDRTRTECFGCHVTGYGEPGGYVSEEETPDLTGVQCESCHGPGNAHAEAAKEAESKEESKDDLDEETKKRMLSLINKVPQNTCVRCHNPHKTHDDYEKEGKTGQAGVEAGPSERK